MVGGGDLRRGETGHLGESLDVSVIRDGFCGIGARMIGPLLEGGGSVGVLAVDSDDREEALGMEERDLIGLDS